MSYVVVYSQKRTADITHWLIECHAYGPFATQAEANDYISARGPGPEWRALALPVRAPLPSPVPAAELLQ